jgi:hypothetical protein
LSLFPADVQANGFFQVAVPIGWFRTNSEYDPAKARVRSSFSSPERLSVIDAILQFGVNFTSLEEVAAQVLDDSFFVDAWARYDGFTETGESITTAIRTEFNLVSDGVDYIGRQVASLQGDRLLILRYVVPANNPPLLEALDSLTTPTMLNFAEQDSTQASLVAYIDTTWGFIIRHPNWQVISGSPGRPAVLEDPATKGRLFLQSQGGLSLDSLEAAQAYVSGDLHPGAAIFSSQVEEGQYGSGYLLSYSDQDTDGNPVSGLIALAQNPTTQQWVVADFRFPEPNFDLLLADQAPGFQLLRTALGSLMILPPPTSAASNE